MNLGKGVDRSMTAPVALFLYDDVSRLEFSANSFLWTALRVGFRSIAAAWREMQIGRQGVSIQRGFEAIGVRARRVLDSGELIQPDLIIHRHLVWGRSETVIAKLARHYPRALCSYHPQWRQIGDKWMTEVCMRKAAQRGIHVRRPTTYLIQKRNARHQLAAVGRSKPLIFKPSSTSECIGILLSDPRTFDGVVHNILHSEWPRFVAQDLIVDSVLYEERKFDLRVYVLVHSFFPLRYQTFREGVARIAAEAFAASRVMEPLCVLTGNSYRVRLGYAPHNVSITNVLKYLKRRGADVSGFWDEVDALVKTVLSAYGQYLAAAKQLRRKFYFAGMDLLMVPRGHSFELMFLETNYVPQLADWGDLSLAAVHHQLLEELLGSVRQQSPRGGICRSAALRDVGRQRRARAINVRERKVRSGNRASPD
jgi:Tubulin-tyrosine ligase family